jgi:hypothetical protein
VHLFRLLYQVEIRHFPNISNSSAPHKPWDAVTVHCHYGNFPVAVFAADDFGPRNRPAPKASAVHGRLLRQMW